MSESLNTSLINCLCGEFEKDILMFGIIMNLLIKDFWPGLRNEQHVEIVFLVHSKMSFWQERGNKFQ